MTRDEIESRLRNALYLPPSKTVDCVRELVDQLVREKISLAHLFNCPAWDVFRTIYPRLLFRPVYPHFAEVN